MRTETNPTVNRYEFSAPGRYRIVVHGHLRPDWSDRFGDMQILARSSDADSDETVMQGCVKDQAELSGILNTLYELHLTLCSVQYLGDEDPTRN